MLFERFGEGGIIFSPEMALMEISDVSMHGLPQKLNFASEL